MGKKAIVVLLVCLALASVHSADAQQPTKVPKIGWLGARSALAPARDVFERELRALGYVEGKNIAFEYRYAEGRLDRLPALADELIRLKVDVAPHAGHLCCGSRQERYQDDPHRFLHRV